MHILNIRQFNNFAFTAGTSKNYRFGTDIFDRNGNFDQYKLNNPQGILEDLGHWKADDGRKAYIDEIIEFVKGSKVFLNERIRGVIGFGGATTAFDIGEGRALKISTENPFQYRQYNKRFDIPLLSQVYEYNNLYGYIQAKADKNTTIKDVKSVKRRMKRAGFVPSCDFEDYRTEQVGRYNGKSYLLDSRCAVRRNDLKTRFSDWFYKHCYMGERVYILNKVDPTAPIVHVNEAPRPDYTWGKAVSIIKKVIKSWIK